MCRIRLKSKKLKGILVHLLIFLLVFSFYLVYSNRSFNFLHHNTFTCIVTKEIKFKHRLKIFTCFSMPRVNLNAYGRKRFVINFSHISLCTKSNLILAIQLFYLLLLLPMVNLLYYLALCLFGFE